ncbi:MAG: cytochrome c oxidase subunit 3 [Pyrinomonadaceae bacterium]|nr:cytochrome c oxidase subunit 3 [Pyrinomonadaceae bacterium]
MVAVVRKEIVPGSSASEDRYRMGMWVALAAILMMFTALTSAYIVRAASSNDWRPIAMPRILLLSTAFIIISSATIEIARRKLKSAQKDSYRRWLLLTIALGFGFLGSQLLAWRQLVGQGIYVASNPHSSFFYLLTATHGLHLLGGLLAVAYLLVRTRKLQGNDQAQTGPQAAAGAVTLYWHFMDGLWIYLFLLLFFWRQ